MSRAEQEKGEDVAETSSATGSDRAGQVGTDVREERDGDVCRLAVTGELTEATRRPLVRALTDVLLEVPTLRRVELLLGEVGFMNSAGLAVLVQLQKLAAPRRVDVVLVHPPAAVSRPLQLSGLWHRFTVTEA